MDPPVSIGPHHQLAAKRIAGSDINIEHRLIKDQNISINPDDPLVAFGDKRLEVVKPRNVGDGK